METKREPIRVLIADDSPVVRRLVERVLGREPGIEVVGAVSNGALVLQGAVARQYDVLVLDLEMPEFDGLATMRALRELRSDALVLVFTGADEEGVRRGLAAYQRGAVEVLQKPENLGASLGELQTKMPALVWALVERRRGSAARAVPAPGAAAQPPVTTAAAPTGAAPTGPAGLRSTELLVIGSSTGGPNALARVLGALPKDLRVPVLIVQHMPEGFTAQLAERLDRDGPLRVVEAHGGEALQPGTAYLAPGGKHLEVQTRGTGLFTRLTDGPLENSCRPAVDPLFRSAARAVGGNVLAVVLTGMGQDGLEGARVVRSAGGRVFAQDQATSVVWGMPGAIVRANLADEVLPLDAVAAAIVTELRKGRASRAPVKDEAA